MCRLPLIFPSFGVVLCPHPWFCLVLQFQSTSGSSSSERKHSYISQGYGRGSSLAGQTQEEIWRLDSVFVSVSFCLSASLSLLVSLIYTLVFRASRYLQFLSISASQCNESALLIIDFPSSGQVFSQLSLFHELSNFQKLFSTLLCCHLCSVKFITSSI